MRWDQDADKAPPARPLLVPFVVRSGELAILKAPPDTTAAAVLHQMHLGTSYGFVHIHRDSAGSTAQQACHDGTHSLSC